jgi:phosphoribosylamine--glycine ligase
MNILVVGSGGREHAIVWKVAQSPKLTKLYAIPGNPGMAELAECVLLKVDDHISIVGFCKEKQIDLVIVGPEMPLAAGLADALLDAGIRCFGPRQAAAQIESSKSFAKDFMQRHNIPTAKYARFVDCSDAIKYLSSMVDGPLSVVIKASGLAAGKGVILPETLDEAKFALEAIMLQKEFGAAGDEVVIEERLSGPEVSLMAFADGKAIVPTISAQDHKRLLDGDRGPNTGGMGAYAPAPICPPELVDEVVKTVLQPTVDGLRQEGMPFVGVLYAGLMLTADGPKVLEFNCRFGDPETQVVLPLLETDLVEIALACTEGRLVDVEICWKRSSAACVILASKGYPGRLETGQPVEFGALPDNAICFHAGTRLENGQVVTSGGRVFGVAAWDESLPGAVERTYRAVDAVMFDGRQWRKDIASRALKADFQTGLGNG